MGIKGVLPEFQEFLLANKLAQLLAEMKRLIRLKHFAYSTELSYIDWVERFFAYMRGIMKDDPDADLRPAKGRALTFSSS